MKRVPPDHRGPRAIPDLPPDLMDIPAASRRLGISDHTGYNLARQGTFPGCMKIGNKWRVSVVRLEKYLHGDSAAS